VQGFRVAGSAPGDEEIGLEMIDCPLDRSACFVGFDPFVAAPVGSGESPEVLLGVDVKHAAAG
jgi:hypothetical protein